MQEILDVPQREGKSNVQHHCEADDLGGCLEIAEGAGHPPRLLAVDRQLKPVSSDSALQLLQGSRI
jgi:hypothetical protein